MCFDKFIGLVILEKENNLESGEIFMTIANGRDKLQRVAFETTDSAGNSSVFKFAINPTSMVESMGARNVFQQPEAQVQMQGYGQGLHTITIQGTTGVNRGQGFDKMMALKKIIVDQINNVHDSTSGAWQNNPAMTSLKFHNFTNNESWKVEMNTDGISIQQSADNPLSYTYNISMVIVGKADVPSTAELTWVQLGNDIPSLPVNYVPSDYEYQYGKTALKDLDASGYASSYDQFIASRKESISNYGQTGMYTQKAIMSKTQVTAMYKAVYGETVKDVDFDKYVSASKFFGGSKQGSINNYGQANEESVKDASKLLPVEDLQQTYNTLYAGTLNTIDYASYTRLEALYKTMKLGSIYNYENEGDQVDTSDDSLNVPDAVNMYSIIYGRTVQKVDYDNYSNAAMTFNSIKKESISDYGQANANDAMFNSYKDLKNQVRVTYPTELNPWEAINNSQQTILQSGSPTYVHPNVSKTAMSYGSNAITNILKV